MTPKSAHDLRTLILMRDGAVPGQPGRFATDEEDLVREEDPVPARPSLAEYRSRGVDFALPAVIESAVRGTRLTRLEIHHSSENDDLDHTDTCRYTQFAINSVHSLRVLSLSMYVVGDCSKSSAFYCCPKTCAAYDDVIDLLGAHKTIENLTLTNCSEKHYQAMIVRTIQSCTQVRQLTISPDHTLVDVEPRVLHNALLSVRQRSELADLYLVNEEYGNGAQFTRFYGNRELPLLSDYQVRAGITLWTNTEDEDHNTSTAGANHGVMIRRVAWMQACVVAASMRACHGHAFRDAILTVVSAIVHITGCVQEPAWVAGHAKLSRLTNTRFVKHIVESRWVPRPATAAPAIASPVPTPEGDSDNDVVVLSPRTAAAASRKRKAL